MPTACTWLHADFLLPDMAMLTHMHTLWRHPSILRSYVPILLLSHMRANTSLLGHIFGSNPEVEGYYELHMGYYSWKSLLRQKLLYFATHRPKAAGRFIFDKVLHNDHAVNLEIFRHARVIFALRSPKRTIPSIMNLYSRLEPEHANATPEGATDYYIGRLVTLQNLAKGSPVNFLYLDADALRLATDRTLAMLTTFVGLQHPLREDYEVRPLTGAPKVGDTSDSIGLGRVRRAQHNYGEIIVPEPIMKRAEHAYHETRASLLGYPRCSGSILLENVAEQASAS